MGLSKLSAAALAAGAAKGNFGAGAVLQVVQVTGPATDVNSTVATPIMTLNITPASANNKVLLLAVAYMSSGGGGSNTWIGTFFQRGGSQIGPDIYFGAAVNQTTALTNTYLDSPNTTSQITYSLMGQKGSGGTPSWIANANRCTFIAMEIAG